MTSCEKHELAEQQSVEIAKNLAHQSPIHAPGHGPKISFIPMTHGPVQSTLLIMMVLVCLAHLLTVINDQVCFFGSAIVKEELKDNRLWCGDGKIMDIVTVHWPVDNVLPQWGDTADWNGTLVFPAHSVNEGLEPWQIVFGVSASHSLGDGSCCDACDGCMLSRVETSWRLL